MDAMSPLPVLVLAAIVAAALVVLLARARLVFHRSIMDWSEAEDGTDVRDYGWYVTLFIRGKHRARWHSTKNTTRMWPHFSRGADEDCNRAVTLALWPLGHLDIWWETRWRAEGSGSCDACLRELEEKT